MEKKIISIFIIILFFIICSGKSNREKEKYQFVEEKNSNTSSQNFPKENVQGMVPEFKINDLKMNGDKVEFLLEVRGVIDHLVLKEISFVEGTEVDGDAIETYGTIQNSSILIKTDKPEFFPNRKLYWRHASGLKYSLIIKKDITKEDIREEGF